MKFEKEDPNKVVAVADFNTMFVCSFYVRRSQEWKKTVKSQCLLALLEPAHEKAAPEILAKLTPEVNFINILLANSLYTNALCSFL